MKTLNFMGLLLLALLACSASCDKNEMPEGPQSKVQGTWKYVGYSGGLVGFPYKGDTSKAGYLQFKDSAYVRYFNEQKSCGYFHISRDQEHAVVKGPYLVFGDGSSGPAIRFKNDTLMLIQPYADGMTSYFVPSDTTLRPCLKMVPY